MNFENQNSIKERILEKIKQGKVKMRPKIYFVFKTILIIFGIFLFLGLSLFLLSFIHFHLRISGLWYLPRFGLGGLAIYFKSLPWLLILVFIVLILLLEVLSRKFSIVWKKPLLYSFLAIFAILIIGTFILDKTSVHPRLLFETQRGKIPPLAPLYREIGLPEFRDFHRGIVERVGEKEFLLKKVDGKELKVSFPKEIKFPLELEIKEGDSVVIMGKKEDSKIKAIKIRKVEDRFKFFERELLRQRIKRGR